jgi:5-formyltetrahydrofolate cyclo-ligase
MPESNGETSAEQRMRAQAKQALRERMRSLRRVLPAEAAAARSAAICDRLQGLEAFGRAALIAGYSAYRKEADPNKALARAAELGKRLALPRVGEESALSLHAYRPGDALEQNAYDIAEPVAAAEVIALGDVELIIVPALAIDVRGHRIGHGHGYYDRLLPQLPRALKVAIGYDFQLLAELPDQPGDARVDCVVTDTRVVWCEG